MNSIKQKIISYVTEKRDWVYGGSLEDNIRYENGQKCSTTSRRCRELVAEGILEARYVNVPGVANKVVQYRIKSLAECIYKVDECPICPRQPINYLIDLTQPEPVQMKLL